nr:unnamed protein product [Callosobruchus analis]
MHSQMFIKYYAS